MIKYSRQRESIKRCLMGRKDHPTAEMVYVSIKEEFPNISLGTVYRNLSLLSDLGEIQKITTGQGPDRFDGNVSPHSHFCCRRCGKVTDMETVLPAKVVKTAAQESGGEIEGYQLQFFGICQDCCKAKP